MSSTTPEELGKAKLKATHGNMRVGDPVWIRNPDAKSEDIYLPAKLHSIATGTTVKIDTGKTKLEIPIDEIMPANNDTGKEDICTLLHLNEPSILDNVQSRFAKAEVYTWTSTILIAMNPFQARPELYTGEMQQKFSKLSPSSAPAHIYATVEKAFRGIQLTKYRPQALIISGTLRTCAAPPPHPPCRCTRSRIIRMPLGELPLSVLVRLSPLLPVCGPFCTPPGRPRHSPYVARCRRSMRWPVLRRNSLLWTSSRVLFSGESGAGKTFTNRLALSYLRYRAETNTGEVNKASETVAMVMSESNPIFEAFGNAKTVPAHSRTARAPHVPLGPAPGPLPATLYTHLSGPQ